MSYRENKMCSETSEAVGTTWEHAQLEIQKFLKIRITLLSGHRRVRQALASKTCHLTEGNTFKSRSDAKAAMRNCTPESKANYPLTKGDFIELESMRKLAKENSHSVPMGALRK